MWDRKIGVDAAIQLLSCSNVLQGNILSCGFRNGVISTIDLRKPAPKESGMHHRADSAVNGGNSGYQYKSKGINPNVKNQHFGVAHANVRPLPGLFHSVSSLSNSVARVILLICLGSCYDTAGYAIAGQAKQST